MSRPDPARARPTRLSLALLASLLGHGLLLWPPHRTLPPPAQTPALHAKLATPTPTSNTPPLLAEVQLKQQRQQASADEHSAPGVSARQRPRLTTTQTAATTVHARDWTQQVREHLQTLDRQGLFYPREAIARGWQGEVLILLVLDADGSVAAARVEDSSGYPVLDQAALRAVRSLATLPASAPREALLPVRFRLH